MKLYDEGLRKGESMIVVPSSYADRVGTGQLMAQNLGHAVYYFISAMLNPQLPRESLGGPAS